MLAEQFLFASDGGEELVAGWVSSRRSMLGKRDASVFGAPGAGAEQMHDKERMTCGA